MKLKGLQLGHTAKPTPTDMGMSVPLLMITGKTNTEMDRMIQPIIIQNKITKILKIKKYQIPKQMKTIKKVLLIKELIKINQT